MIIAATATRHFGFNASGSSNVRDQMSLSNDSAGSKKAPANRNACCSITFRRGTLSLVGGGRCT